MNAESKQGLISNEELKEENKEVEEIDIDSEMKRFKYDIEAKLSEEELSQYEKEVQVVYKHKSEYKLNDNGSSISFYPSPHLKPNEYAQETLATKSLTNSWIIRNNVNALFGMNNWNESLIIENEEICSFIHCCNKAWSKHYPLKISPSHILLLILQSIAIHVDKNSEKLRNKYVKHEDKMQLTVNRIDDPNFKLGAKDNDWSSVIDEFCQQIDKNTCDDTVLLMQSDFSCSTMIDKISNKITIMDICKNYFQYYGYSGDLCGFPKITLNGTKEDWIKLRIKCQHLLDKKVDKKFGAKWSLSLLAILDRFIAVYDGNIDCIFWNSMIYRRIDTWMGSGGPDPDQYHGWINVFFPFMQGDGGEFYENRYCFIPYKMNKYQSLAEQFGSGGGECTKFPAGISYAPVSWTDINEGKEYKLKFCSGFVGYKQCAKTYELEPVVSWFIGDEKK